ncbi:hypothetical protein NQZ68_013423 [Dissostichus eleginoides]|nr:hypothetical protein NQZ68_013423 [Dissostichus eleginoides]
MMPWNSIISSKADTPPVHPPTGANASVIPTPIPSSPSNSPPSQDAPHHLSSPHFLSHLRMQIPHAEEKDAHFTTLKQLRSIFGLAKTVFPGATLYFPHIQYSSSLPLTHQYNLDIINNTCFTDAKHLAGISDDIFTTRADIIHCLTHFPQLAATTTTEFLNTLKTNPGHTTNPLTQHPPSTVLNLSKLCTPSAAQQQLLKRGLTFVPRPSAFDWEELHRDLHKYQRRIKLIDYFDLHTPLQPRLFMHPSNWDPLTSQLDTNTQTLIHSDLQALRTHRPPPDVPDNLTGA